MVEVQIFRARFEQGPSPKYTPDPNLGPVISGGLDPVFSKRYVNTSPSETDQLIWPSAGQISDSAEILPQEFRQDLTNGS